MRTIKPKDILQILDALPNDKKKEVYDFIEFLRAKTATEKIQKKELIGRIYGSTKGSRLTADLFSKMKAEEIALENK